MRIYQVLKALTVSVILYLSSSTLILAQKPFAGTWKLDIAKSKFTSDAGLKEMTESFEAVGDQWKYVGTGKDSDGNPISEHFIMAFDGKDHAVDEPGLTIAVTRVDDYTLHVIVKKYDSVVDSDDSVVSKDGKTMTVSKDDKSVLVFEKQ
jgi:hypothetical protein